jgi:hypothetical protein
LPLTLTMFSLEDLLGRSAHSSSDGSSSPLARRYIGRVRVGVFSGPWLSVRRRPRPHRPSR